MNSAAKSVYYFGFYLIGLGIILMTFPNVLLGMFQFEPTQEVWIRVAGLLVLDIGVFYLIVAPTNNEVFIKVSAYNRFLVFVTFVVFVVIGLAKPMLIMFGAVDLAGGLWTYLSIKKNNH